MNIYNFASNEGEWTLEKTSFSNDHCAFRGGDFGDTGSSYPASDRNSGITTSSGIFIGFRPALYVN